MISSPLISSKAPANQANRTLSKKAAARTAMSGIRTTMMPGAMASQGPMTRANARVLACDCSVAGMGFLPAGASFGVNVSDVSYIRDIPNMSNKNPSTAERRFIEDVTRLMVPWGVPPTVARRHGERGSKRALYGVSENYEGMLTEQNRLLDALAALLRTGAATAASETTRGRLEEMADFYLAIREAMESALQRWRAKGAPRSDRQPRARP